MRLNLRKLRLALILYVLFDLYIGGHCAGLFPLSELAAAQFTTVTGTVTDPSGLPYAGGTISAGLVLPGGTSPTLNGLPYTPPSQAVGLDRNGSFTMQLADNTVLLPAATKWTFLVCSAVGTVQPAGGRGPVCFNVPAITISGGSQSITSNIAAVPPPALTIATSITGSGTNPFVATTTLQLPAGACPNPSLGFGNSVDGFFGFGTHQVGMCSNGFLAANFNGSDGFILNGATFLGWCGGSSGTCLDGQVTLSNTGFSLIGVGNGAANPTTGGFAASAYALALKSTAALTAGQAVKIDSANNTSVVVATTADTGGGIPIGIVSNSPGAGATAYVLTSGLIATPVLGTGTCAIGQFVIVDTTTNGRVKCTSTYTAGTEIGICTVAQSTVGNPVSVMVQIR